MKLIFERGAEGRGLSLLPENDVPAYEIQSPKRAAAPRLPQVSETELSRHYTELEKQCFGVNDGFYPLGSCTMKYNPKVDEDAAALKGFTGIHPLQPEDTVQGCREVTDTLKKYLCEITGMDAITLQPAAGAHGEFTGLLTIKAYHQAKNDPGRTKIIVPDSAHGTNPASASMAGFQVVSIDSDENGCVDLDALRAAVGEDTAGLMLTNPNTVGLFDPNIAEITGIVHQAGGLCYYDGANLNAIAGVARPGDMGFDVVHLNLHKSFAAPHGGGGPGAGPVGCKEFLKEYLPKHMKAFYGNFLVAVKSLTYLLMLGREGVPEIGKNAVLNANYMKKKLSAAYDMAYDHTCMHEFVMTLSKLKKETGVSALDVAKGMIDHGIHPPTMYFPLIVDEALMIEPTETEPREVLDHACEVLLELAKKAETDPEYLHGAPHDRPIGRPDEVAAARKPVLRYSFGEE